MYGWAQVLLFQARSKEHQTRVNDPSQQRWLSRACAFDAADVIDREAAIQEKAAEAA
jgi:hypothetical protein